jgi:hypothetical protein
MPQNPTGWWKRHLGDEAELTHELLLHTIGNLTLTAYNSELADRDFESKKGRLKESHLEINKYFGDRASWRKEDIETRSSYLTEIALRICKVTPIVKTKNRAREGGSGRH